MAANFGYVLWAHWHVCVVLSLGRTSLALESAVQIEMRNNRSSAYSTTRSISLISIFTARDRIAPEFIIPNGVFKNSLSMSIVTNDRRCVQGIALPNDSQILYLLTLTNDVCLMA
ncbi:hypothetical protein PoB_001304300 [Plakobranchus ocellatus]|uniref:Secreted protein n=1 Tax=Plakobranchus ocellatus TaxID=259542 RepID=A0AAV3YVE4_9GAST|nr:hypothetical protein PoB_001304300 [Plakobranchus ocellatus]